MGNIKRDPSTYFFKPGHKKSGGRRAGIKNKSKTVRELCQQKGIDPIMILIDLCSDPNKHMRFMAARELCKYVHPQLKQIEMTAHVIQKPSIMVLRDGTEVHFTKKEEEKIVGGNDALEPTALQMPSPEEVSNE